MLIVKHNSFHILTLVYWNICFTYMYLHWYYSRKASNQIFLMQKYIISADNYPNIFIHVQRKTTSLCTCLISIQLVLVQKVQMNRSPFYLFEFLYDLELEWWPCRINRSTNMNKYSTPNLITPLDTAIVTYDLCLSNITNCGH